MNLFLLYVFLFFLGSVLGWCMELIYRRFKPGNKERKWVNPGFLTGPYLPIYGFGLCALHTLSSINIHTGSGVLDFVLLFVVIGLVMTLIELIAGEIFILGLHVKLWDYSKRWMNYKGIICPLFSLVWAVLGSAYYFFVNPYVVRAILWFEQHLAFSFVVGVFFGVFIIDFVYSCNLVTKVRAFAKENNILVHYEELRANARETSKQRKEKLKFIFSFTSPTAVSEHLKNYHEKLSKAREKKEETPSDKS